METWITDAAGNRCSVQRYGSEKAARAALATLKNCSGYTGCSGCSDCSDCSDCSRCSGCSDLKDAAPVAGASNGPPPVPIVPDLHAKIFAAVSQPGALEMDVWHTCEKTHCRAGWVIALAGAEGRALEEFFDTPLAARKIYDASCPGYLINPARFFDSNKDALEDMRKLTEAEK